MNKKKIARSSRARKPATKPATFTLQDRAELRERVQAKAGKPPEPTFSLGSVSEAFGFAIGLHENRNDPLYFARNAILDAKATLRLVEEVIVNGNENAMMVLQDVVSNAAMRAEVADGILARFTHPLTEKPATAEGSVTP